MTDRHFDAILAKNYLARAVADLVRDGAVSGHQGRWLVARLEEIEEHTGRANQPGVWDIFENNTNPEAEFFL